MAMTHIQMAVARLRHGDKVESPRGSLRRGDRWWWKTRTKPQPGQLDRKHQQQRNFPGSGMTSRTIFATLQAEIGRGDEADPGKIQDRLAALNANLKRAYTVEML